MTGDRSTPTELSAVDLRRASENFDVDLGRVLDELASLGPWVATGGAIPIELPGEPLHPSGTGAFQLVVGEPSLVVVTDVGDGSLAVAQLKVVWTGSHDPRPYRRNGRLAVLPAGWGDTETRTQLLVTLVRQAATDRRKGFRRCDRCRELQPPEWMHDKSYCSSCAERFLDIKY